MAYVIILFFEVAPYRVLVKLTMLYGAECWSVKNSDVQKMKVVEIKMLRWIYEHTDIDKIRNEDIRDRARVAPVEDKL